MEEGSHRNSGLTEPRDPLVTLIRRALMECGITIAREEKSAGRSLELEGIPAAPASSLLVGAEVIRWEYCPPEDGETDPKRIADITTALLADEDPPYERLGDGYDVPAMTFKGIVGRELQARGLSVELQIYEDHLALDAWADIFVSSAKESGMRVLVDDDGCITWESDHLTDARAIANDVKTRMRRVISV